MEGMVKRLRELVGQDLVLDTASPYLYIGRLTEADEWFVRLADADVHDASETQTTKEVYLIEARKFGVKKNRVNVLVRTDKVISISLLSEVIEY